MKKIILNFNTLLLLFIFFTVYNNLISAEYWPNAIEEKTYDNSGCGLDYIHKGVKITGREIDAGTVNPTPVLINLSELPNDSCYGIEKAYIYCVFSDRDPLQNSLKVTVRNPQNNTTDFDAVQIGEGEQTGYFNAPNKAFRADVTSNITTNGDYYIDVDCEDWEATGVSLFIIYKNYSADFEGHLVIYDGFLSSYGTVKQTLPSINPCETPYYGKALFIASDIQIFYSGGYQDTCDYINIYVNDSIYSVKREFWNYNSFDYDFHAGNQNLNYTIDAEPTPCMPGIQDYITWMMIGAYYRTKNCTVCPTSLPISINSGTTVSCSGDLLHLVTSIDTVSHIKTTHFEWTSDPPGFVSTEQSPWVTPYQSTTYYVKAVIGNDCRIGYDTVHIDVNPVPLVDAGDSLSVCAGRAVKINAVCSAGTPPYSYSWYPTTGLDDPTSLTPSAIPVTPTMYYITTTDVHGCMAMDSVFIGFSVADKAYITALGPTTICECDSVALDAGTGFVIYNWSNGDSTRVIQAKDPGPYYCLTEDINGCKGTSDTINVTVVVPQTILSFDKPQYNAEAGSKIQSQLILNDLNNHDICNYNGFHAVIAFNKTLLAPISPTPLGITDDTWRKIEISGFRQAGETVLANFEYMVTLGNSVSTPIEIDTFYWDRCIDLPPQITNSVFNIDGLCYQGGARLFFEESAPPVILLPNAPDPFSESTELFFYIKENQHIKIEILDLFGCVAAVAADGDYDKGLNHVSLSSARLASGAYLCRMISKMGSQTEVIQVVK